MANTNYKAILNQELDSYAELEEKRRQLDIEMERKFQYIAATFNMLDEADKPAFEDRIRNAKSQAEGLSAAVRHVLKDAPGKWHTATTMRDKLAEAGFDFTGYTSNPLASIHVVMKRLKPEEFVTGSVDGVMAWRWVETEQDPDAPHRRRLLAKPAKPFGANNSLANMLLKKPR